MGEGISIPFNSLPEIEELSSLSMLGDRVRCVMDEQTHNINIFVANLRILQLQFDEQTNSYCVKVWNEDGEPSGYVLDFKAQLTEPYIVTGMLPIEISVNAYSEQHAKEIVDKIIDKKFAKAAVQGLTLPLPLQMVEVDKSEERYHNE